MDFEIFGDYDRKFVTYASCWAAEELTKCESEDDFTAFPHLITTKLKNHMVDLEEYFYITHCDANATEEEKFAAAKRYEEHVNYACSLTWVLFLRGLEQELESSHEELEKDSPPVCVDE